MKKQFLLFAVFCNILAFVVKAQDFPVKPTTVINAVFLGETPPLKDLPVLTPEEIEFMKEKALLKAARKVIKPRLYPYAATAMPQGEDAVWQKSMPKSLTNKAPLVNFEGQTTSSYPPDCNGTVGPSHYMQTVNTTYAIYNKTGTLLAGPTNMNLLFNGVSGANCNDGDPLVQYDEQAQRWIAVEFSLCGANDLMLVAVSSTNDPTGTWYAYSFDVADMPDYEKIGIWQDGYYMGTNTGSGNDIYVMERSKMLQGLPAQMVAFDNSWRPGPSTNFLCVPPLDNDVTFAPAGSPGLFIAFNDDAVGGGTDQLWIYELAVDWTTPANSTFVRSQQINVTAFDSQFNASWNDITQPTSQKLDGVPQVIMNAPQYRNFGTYQTIVCCHTVDVDATDHAGIRWYELRKTPPSTTWVKRQEGTFAPDVHSRWMGSIMLNGNGKIGLAYSISSSTIYPGIRYCGQSAGAYANATGLMDVPEEVIYNGTVAQTTYNRWGDYALLSVDPSDDETFWFTSEYVKTGGSTKGTRIASFRIGSAPFVTTNAATNVSAPNATLNGTVNPNGLATTYYFEWGTTTSYGNTTTVTSAGSGTSNVPVSANITGLVGGTPYHFRVVATNSDGTTNGTDLTFTPGAVSLTTTAASAITMTTATAGGNVITDGGSPVTARGVCWATTANPVATGNHTTDGTGTGIFTSSITGLSANTLYHVRAYATNSNGTFYGSDLTFTTLCGKITSFPWNEGFENGGVIPGCWSQEQVASSGINWVFITGSGNNNPAVAHTGTYDACLKDATAADNKTKLITPSLDLTAVSSPQLKFWHTQVLWSPDQDVLTVFYKTSVGGTWTQLATYTTNISVWTQETITLPNLSSDYYIAFEGNAKYGYGVCVDDVSITGGCTLPLAAGTITGTATVCKGDANVAYSVPAITGATSYIWAYSGTGATITGTTNNVTLTFASNATSGNLTVYGVNTCGNGTISANYPIVVNGIPVAAGTITGSPLVCQGATSVAYNVPAITNATSYVWAYSGTGATITGSTNSITVTFAANATSGNLSVYGTSSCGNGTISANYPVTVNTAPGAAGTISGTATVCQGATSIVYSVPLISNAASYVWAYSGTGASITGTTNNVTITFASNATSGNLTVYGTSTCGNGTISANYPITVNPLPNAAGAISGTSAVCQGATSVAYNVGAITNASSYAWAYSGTGASISGSSNSVTITFAANATSGNLTVYGVNSCGNGTVSSNYPVTVNSLPLAAGTITGAASVCVGSTSIAYSVPTISGTSSYVWAYSGTGATITGSTNSVSITFASNATSGNLTVYGTNTCGNGTISANYPITVGALPAIVNVIGGGTVCGSTTLSASNGADGTIYFQGNISNGTSITTPAVSQVVSTSDTYYFRAQSSLGCWGPQGSSAVTIKPLPVITSFTATPSVICSGNTTSLSATATGEGGSFTTSAASGAINVAIPSASLTGVSTTLPITTGTGNIDANSNIQVTLSITHPRDSDLDIYLVGPGNCGTMELSTDNGSTSANYTNTILSTAATNIIGVSGSAPFTGTFRPEGTISTPPGLVSGVGGGTYSLPTAALLGCPVNGSWRLFVGDDRTSNTGTITKFDLTITGTGGIFTHAFSGNGSIGVVSYSGTSNQTGTTTVTNAPTGTNTYTVVSTGPNGCSNTTTTNLTVNQPTIAATNVSATSTNICSGNQIILTQTGGVLGTGAYWQWYTDPTYTTPIGGQITSADAGLTISPSIAATYYVRGEGGSVPCQTNVGDNSKSVTVTVIQTPLAPSGSALQTFCNAATIANLQATGTGIQWYATSGGGAPLSPLTPLVNGEHYFSSQTISGCESVGRFDVTVTINTPATPNGAASQTFCNGATVDDLQATGTGIQWYLTSGGGTPLSTAISLINGTHYFASQTINSCESSGRLDVLIAITQPTIAATIVSATATDICIGSSITLSQTGGTLGTGAYWQWYTDPSYTNAIGGPLSSADASLTITPTATATYYVRGEGTTAPCASNVGDNSKTVTVTIHEQPFVGTLIKTPAVAVVCAGQNVSAAATAGNGGAGMTTDVLEYRYDGGTWNPYISETLLTTAGHSTVEIRTYRTSSVTGCNTSAISQVGWIISVPSSLNATNITTSSADLSWTDLNGSLWNIEYGLQGYTQGTGTLIGGITSQSFNVTGLNSGTYYSFYVQTDCGGQNGLWVGPYNFVTDNGLTKTLQIKLFLEGLYAGGGLMNQAQGISGPQFGAGIADRVTVELHNASFPYDVAYTFSNVDVNTNGTFIINSIPGNISGFFYLVVKHRNSIETWSSMSVDFGSALPVIYDFSTSASMAYGNNMKLMTQSVYAIWSGDATQDGNIDLSDMTAIDNASTIILQGYYPEDVNGDGVVDLSDMTIIDNNSLAPQVSVKKP